MIMARELVTDNNYSPLIHILTWFVLIVAILAIMARDGTKLAFSKSISKFDDWAIHLALVFAIGQSAATTVAAANGLGKPASMSSPSAIERIYKVISAIELALGIILTKIQAQFAAMLMYTASLCLSKLCILGFAVNLSPLHPHKRRIHAVAALILIWAIIGICMTTAQCTRPSWRMFGKSCRINPIKWWIAYDAVNIAVDFVLIGILISLIWAIKMALSKKISLSLYFSLRLVLIAGFLCNIVFHHQLLSSHDFIKDGWRMTISMQCTQAASIVTACALYLKPFLMEVMRSGFTRVDDLRRRNPAPFARYDSYDLSVDSKDAHERSEARSEKKGSLGTLVTITAHQGAGPQEFDQAGDTNAIKRDTSWTVVTEPAFVTHAVLRV